jgi:hypothetical protein
VVHLASQNTSSCLRAIHSQVLSENQKATAQTARIAFRKKKGGFAKNNWSC